MAKSYKTSITTHIAGRPHVYGFDLAKLAGEISFTRAIYLVLMGKMPDKNSEKMLDALLTIAIDHGVEPPSTVAARNVYSGGSPIQAAVASGILAFGQYHGGAIEEAMENFKQYQARGAEAMIEEFDKGGKRIAGFGHKLYTTDPRTERLVTIGKELGFFGKYIKFAQEVEKGLSAKKLPLNIDGIMAAILLEMGFSTKVAKGIFIIARVPGIVAHVVEEATREKPFRRLTEQDVEYDGPRPRK